MSAQRTDWQISTDGGRVVASVGDYYLAQDIAIQLRNENPGKCFVVGRPRDGARRISRMDTPATPEQRDANDERELQRALKADR